jgi:hypothetical protein
MWQALSRTGAESAGAPILSITAIRKTGEI